MHIRVKIGEGAPRGCGWCRGEPKCHQLLSANFDNNRFLGGFKILTSKCSIMNGEELKFRVFLFMQELLFPVPAPPWVYGLGWGEHLGRRALEITVSNSTIWHVERLRPRERRDLPTGSQPGPEPTQVVSGFWLLPPLLQLGSSILGTYRSPDV